MVGAVNDLIERLRAHATNRAYIRDIYMLEAADALEAAQADARQKETVLRCVRPLLIDLSDNSKWSVGSSMWNFGQDAKVQLRAIDAAIDADQHREGA